MTLSRPIWATARDIAPLFGWGINKARPLLRRWATDARPDGQAVVRTYGKGSPKGKNGAPVVHTVMYRVDDVDDRVLLASANGEIL